MFSVRQPTRHSGHQPGLLQLLPNKLTGQIQLLSLRIWNASIKTEVQGTETTRIIKITDLFHQIQEALLQGHRLSEVEELEEGKYRFRKRKNESVQKVKNLASRKVL